MSLDRGRRPREADRTIGAAERSLDDVAALIRRSVGALKPNLHRDLKALRAKLNGEGALMVWTPPDGI